MTETLIIPAIKIAVVIQVMLGIVAYTVLAERWVCAWMQDRWGPNRVGPFGLLQPLADGIKFIFKEDVLPHHVRKIYFTLAPACTVVPALITVAVVPWGSFLPIAWGGETFNVKGVIADLDVGLLFVFAIASLGVYGIVLAGWASNSKYPFLGGIRSSAQMISYEVCMGLSVVPVFMQVGSLNLSEVVTYQGSTTWLVLCQPLSFLIFMVSAFAETNRTPFDLPEAEQELVGGYHTEYSSMKFAMFFLGEYAAMFVQSALMVTLFFGGWSLPFAPFDAPATTLGVGLAHVGIFIAKTCCFLFLFIWVRWTVPRFRYDQLMALGWKIFVPLTIINIFITGIVLALFYNK
jgi:NADH-quinone oxidoreductase subunit H